MSQHNLVQHEFAPVFNSTSRILILGTIPSVKSRENGFYYGHPQNRFWRVMAAVLGHAVPQSIPEKTDMLLQNHIALWDVLQSCEIVGSGDSSIRGEIANDLLPLLAQTQITHIITNGQTAEKLYRKYCQAQTGITSVCLPSTSPANAAWSLERLTDAWQAAFLPVLTNS